MLKPGDIVENRLGKCLVKEVVNQKTILVGFLDYNQEKWCSAHDLKRGLVRVHKPTIHGFGIVDISRIKGTWMQIHYERWRSMIRRCYSKNRSGIDTCYSVVTVCDDWARFSNFLEWSKQFEWDGFEIDKDLFSGKVKIYSPETCCVIPNDLNSLINFRYDSPNMLGVSRDNARNKYSSIGKLGVKRFNKEIDAHLYWLEFFIFKLKGFDVDSRVNERLKQLIEISNEILKNSCELTYNYIWRLK